MEIFFTEALRRLPDDAAFRIINAARPGTDYLLNTILPERPMRSYEVSNGTIEVKSAMPGLVGLDSPYPPTGAMTAATFLERTAKVANQVTMSEHALRELQNMALYVRAIGNDSIEQLVQEVLNFIDAVIVQSHLDVAEWLRGQALATGEINWQYGNVSMVVNYNIPATNKLPARTGNNAYGGSTSKFWDDIRAQNRLLRGASRIIRIIHPDLLDNVIYNDVNALQVASVTNGIMTLRRYQTVGGAIVPTSDARDVIEVIPYGMEGEIIDPANPTQTIRVPFWPRTKMVAIGTGVARGYMVGSGSRPQSDVELGYTHLAPTVESGGAPGRWSRVYTPPDRPWQLVGQGVSNVLPVIHADAVTRIVIATSDVS
jgi:hypothetical protein